jgi:membrane-associated protease RseP (regulator of RpoE activity)
VTLALQRGNQTITLTATPLSTRPADQGALGISMGPALVRYGSPLQALGYGSLAVWTQTRLLVSLPAQMISGQITPDQGRFIGLKGIYDLFGQAVNRDVQSRAVMPPAAGAPTAPAPSPAPTPTYFTLELIGILTVSIGIFNLFPFPALDGGRILFVAIELVARRRVPAEYENLVHGIGFAILLAFMVYVNTMDFIHPAIINLP